MSTMTIVLLGGLCCVIIFMLGATSAYYVISKDSAKLTDPTVTDVDMMRPIYDYMGCVPVPTETLHTLICFKSRNQNIQELLSTRTVKSLIKDLHKSVQALDETKELITNGLDVIEEVIWAVD